MREVQDIEVDGVAYSVTSYGGTQGLKLFFKLTKLFGEPLLKSIVTLATSKDPKSQKPKKPSDLLKLDVENDLVKEMISSVAEGLFDRLDENQSVSMVKEILSGTFERGSSVAVCDDFDIRFQGAILHAFKLVGKTLSVQYSDFFGGAASMNRLSEVKA